jgi:general secretion pathway protein H
MNQSGLSLLECLVCLAIAAVMLAVAVPYLEPARASQVLDVEAKRIAVDLRQAQSEAVHNNRQVDFSLDVRSGVFGHGRYERLGSDTQDMAVTLSTTLDQRLSGGAGTIRFFPDGGSTGGGVKLTTSAGTRQVLVDWLTGRVSVVRE